jgi:hypothetical protein
VTRSLALFCFLSLVRPVAAQVIAEQAPPRFPDSKKFSRGFFASGELGALVFLGDGGKYAGPGALFGVRLGYDLFRFLALETHFFGAASSATLPAPTIDQSFQTYLYSAEVRLSAQIRRVALFAEGGAGLVQISSNVLDAVGITEGKKFSLGVVAGGGIDYHTLNRHFSFGLDGDYLWLANFSKTNALSVSGYLRYTH